LLFGLNPIAPTRARERVIANPARVRNEGMTKESFFTNCGGELVSGACGSPSEKTFLWHDEVAPGYYGGSFNVRESTRRGATMLKDVGLVTNCGKWRLSPKVKGERVFVSVAFSVELRESEVAESIPELRAMVEEGMQRWDRARWCKFVKQEKIEKQEKERKKRCIGMK
jgi:hypothetical protein